MWNAFGRVWEEQAKTGSALLSRSKEGCGSKKPKERGKNPYGKKLSFENRKTGEQGIKFRNKVLCCQPRKKNRRGIFEQGGRLVEGDPNLGHRKSWKGEKARDKNHLKSFENRARFPTPGEEWRE